MKNIKAKPLIFLLCLAAALISAGCANSDESEPDAAPAATAAETEAVKEMPVETASAAEETTASNAVISETPAEIKDDFKLDEKEGVLTLKGEVTKEAVKKYSANKKIKSIVADKDCVLPEDCSDLFCAIDHEKHSTDHTRWINVKTIDLSKADSSRVTDTHGMFEECSKLAELDLKGFDTSNVTDMYNMFLDCSSLKKLDISSFNTSKVTDMSQMFRGCSSLTEIDVSGFDTSNVTSLFAMFSSCESLKSIDISSFNTSNVTDMICLFQLCLDLESVNISGLDTSNVTSTSGMFWGCSSLKELDLSGFDTSNVTDMSSMFFSAKKLKSIDLSGFDTSNVTDMSGMFNKAKELTTLDLSAFDTSNVMYSNSMFFDCDDLKTITVSDKWKMDNIADGDAMFEGCSSLVGGSGTKHDKAHDNAEYARIDAKDAPGYLTMKKDNTSTKDDTSK